MSQKSRNLDIQIFYLSHSNRYYLVTWSEDTDVVQFRISKRSAERISADLEIEIQSNEEFLKSQK
jgi:hypothetical protein